MGIPMYGPFDGTSHAHETHLGSLNNKCAWDPTSQLRFERSGVQSHQRFFFFFLRATADSNKHPVCNYGHLKHKALPRAQSTPYELCLLPQD